MDRHRAIGGNNGAIGNRSTTRTRNGNRTTAGTRAATSAGRSAANAAIRAQQNFGLAAAAGLGAALVGAIAWAIVTVITQMELGLMAIAVGYIVGQTIKETCRHPSYRRGDHRVLRPVRRVRRGLRPHRAQR